MTKRPQAELPKLLILSSAESEYFMQIDDDFVGQLNKRLKGVTTIEWHNYHNVGLEIDDGKLRAFLISENKDLKEFKAVYFKTYFRYQEQATAIAEALEENNVTFAGQELRSYIASQKLSQLTRLARAGLNVPHSLYLPLEHYGSHYEEMTAKLGGPFIFKALDASGGRHNYLVRTKAQLNRIVKDNQDKVFIAQTAIPNESDLRVLIVDNDIKLVIERKRNGNGTHLNNTSQGGTAKLLKNEDVSPELHKIALAAAKVMNRDKAGVDIMLETHTNKPYVLEVNAGPQIGSGSFIEEKLTVFTDYFKNLATK